MTDAQVLDLEEFVRGRAAEIGAAPDGQPDYIRDDTDPDYFEDVNEDGVPDVDQPGINAEVYRADVDHYDTEDRLEPILPGWAHRGAFVPAVREYARIKNHNFWYRLTHLPVTYCRLLKLVPRGLLRLVVAFWWFCTAQDHREHLNRIHAEEGKNGRAYQNQLEAKRDSMRWRSGATAVGLTVVGAVVYIKGIGYVAGIEWGLGLDQLVAMAKPLGVLLVLLGGIGALGIQREKPVMDSPVTRAEKPKFDDRLIRKALDNMGVPKLTAAFRAEEKTGEPAIAFTDPIKRDGAGWLAKVVLPAGVTVADIVKQRTKLSSGLRRTESCVFPSMSTGSDGDPLHEAALDIYVSDRPMSSSKPTAWPLLKKGTVDLFSEFRVGVDNRGEPVAMCLMYASMVIGAIPRMGKTFALRLILLAAGLDVTVEISAHNFKGDNALHSLRHFAHYYGYGQQEEKLKVFMGELARLEKEMWRRYEVIDGLDPFECPESKTTVELAAIRRYGLHPIVIAADECQFIFDHPEYGKLAAKRIEDLVKSGPAAGIICIVATQRPDDKSLPTGIRDNVVMRLGLKLMGWQANDMVLGTGAYHEGIDATRFRKSDVGIGWLDAEGVEPSVVRFDYIDGPAAEKLGLRIRELRIKAKRLTGQAAGDSDEEEVEQDTLLDHLDMIWVGVDDDRYVVRAGVEWCHTADLAEQLTEGFPSVYPSLDASKLGSLLASHHVNTKQKKIGGSNRQAISRDQIDGALANQRRIEATGGVANDGGVLAIEHDDGGHLGVVHVPGIITDEERRAMTDDEYETMANVELATDDAIGHGQWWDQFAGQDGHGQLANRVGHGGVSQLATDDGQDGHGQLATDDDDYFDPDDDSDDGDDQGHKFDSPDEFDDEDDDDDFDTSDDRAFESPYVEIKGAEVVDIRRPTSKRPLPPPLPRRDQ